MPLDSTDRRMLAILQREGRIANAALAERLHLSPSPCLRRLRSLERDGVIVGYRAVLDRLKLGLGLTVFAGLKVDRHSDEGAAAISAALRAAPEVISAHIVSGSADFRLGDRRRRSRPPTSDCCSTRCSSSPTSPTCGRSSRCARPSPTGRCRSSG